MIAEITVIISWGAVAVMSSMVLAYLGTVGGVIWKLYAHSSDTERHLGVNEKLIDAGICNVKHAAITSELKEVRDYIGDAEDRTTAAIKELKNDLNEKIDQIIQLVKK